MTTSSPLVSVIIPCYNHEKFVKEALQSVINQTYTNIQLIVIDDGSTDNSVEVIKELKQNFDFVFETQSNIGLSSTLNKGITKYAKGKYIAILASDDIWQENKLSIQVKFLENNKDFAMVCSNAFIVNSQSEIVDKFYNNFTNPNISFTEIALGRKIIPALTVIIRKEIFDFVGLFDKNLLIEDWDMWLRISYKYKVAGIDAYLANYRQHAFNTSSIKLEGMTMSRFEILSKWKGLIKEKLFNKIYRNLEIVAMNELGTNELLKRYVKPTFIKMLNSKYRKLVFKNIYKI
jgi:alpha-1,3-rhamnosyltransferase